MSQLPSGPLGQGQAPSPLNQPGADNPYLSASGVPLWAQGGAPVNIDTDIPPPPDDPCQRLAWGAAVQKTAQLFVQQAALSGKQVVDKLFAATNQFMTETLGSVKYFDKKLGAKSRALQAQATKAKQKLTDKLNATAVSLSRDMHFVADNLTKKLDAQLNPDGAPRMVSPAYVPMTAGQIQEAQGPGGAFMFKAPPATVTRPDGNVPVSVTPATEDAVPITPGPGETIDREGSIIRRSPPEPEGAYDEYQQHIAAAATYRSAPSTATSASSAVSSAMAKLQEQLGPEALAQPLTQVTLQQFAAVMHQCLRPAARQDPVDWDQPNALVFGERGAAWHKRMAQFWQGAYDGLLGAETIGEVRQQRDALKPRVSADRLRRE